MDMHFELLGKEKKDGESAEARRRESPALAKPDPTFPSLLILDAAPRLQPEFATLPCVTLVFVRFSCLKIFSAKWKLCCIAEELSSASDDK